MGTASNSRWKSEAIGTNAKGSAMNKKMLFIFAMAPILMMQACVSTTRYQHLDVGPVASKAELEKKIKKQPADAHLYVELGRSLYEAGQLKEALAAFQKAESLGDKSPAGGVYSAYTMQSLGQTTEAIDKYRESAERTPDPLLRGLQRGVAELLERNEVKQYAASASPNAWSLTRREPRDFAVYALRTNGGQGTQPLELAFGQLLTNDVESVGGKVVPYAEVVAFQRRVPLLSHNVAWMRSFLARCAHVMNAKCVIVAELDSTAGKIDIALTAFEAKDSTIAFTEVVSGSDLVTVTHDARKLVREELQKRGLIGAPPSSEAATARKTQKQSAEADSASENATAGKEFKPKGDIRTIASLNDPRDLAAFVAYSNAVAAEADGRYSEALQGYRALAKQDKQFSGATRSGDRMELLLIVQAAPFNGNFLELVLAYPFPDPLGDLAMFITDEISGSLFPRGREETEIRVPGIGFPPTVPGP